MVDIYAYKSSSERHVESAFPKCIICNYNINFLKCQCKCCKLYEFNKLNYINNVNSEMECVCGLFLIDSYLSADYFDLSNFKKSLKYIDLWISANKHKLTISYAKYIIKHIEKSQKRIYKMITYVFSVPYGQGEIEDYEEAMRVKGYLPALEAIVTYFHNYIMKCENLTRVVFRTLKKNK